MSNLTKNSLDLLVEQRNGEVVSFEYDKIKLAISQAAIAGNVTGQPELYDTIVDEIAEELSNRFVEFHPNVENIHDIVEKHLMRNNLYEVAKCYIVHRAEKKKEREDQRKKVSFLRKLRVFKRDGRKVLFNPKKIYAAIERASEGLDSIDFDAVCDEVTKNSYDGIKTEDIEKSLVLAATAFIEIDPNYSHLAARLFSQRLRKEVFGLSVNGNTEEVYKESFIHSIQTGIDQKLLDPRLGEFDLEALSEKIVINRDNLFKYIGMQTLYQRYFVKHNGQCLELPQTFWMRVAMGMAINEDDKEKRALEFYEAMSKMLYVPSTPTLFHAGLTHPQLSSCYLTTIDDDLKDIFKSFQDNSQLSKWSGGIGNDWTNVRSIGAAIESTRVESQGTIPFLKIANDTTFAINRSGKRRGATVAYLETWHLDIEDFLDLRKNTGDDRRRTHDMNTANWIPDLFIKRVRQNGKWTLFSPDEASDLHHKYGKDFEKAYLSYERKASRGHIAKHKVIDAKKLWKKMLTMLFETGHPWLTFKDPCNVRSPQDHVGVVHSSNLCTEITLNTSTSKMVNEVVENGKMTREYELGEVAVCNLGSVVISNHMNGKKIDRKKLTATIRTAMRMLDNVIDLNFYPIEEARNSNMRHRPVGLGLMGLQDALCMADIEYENSHEFQDELQEFISYHAILSSSRLAKERGAYETFPGSKWDRGIFPFDTVKLLEKERGEKLKIDHTRRMDWDKVYEHVSSHGMRNSNLMAVAPTATIATIVSCSPCTEAYFKNLYVKSNMSGEFTVVNEFLVKDLKKLKLWNKEMLDQLKFHNGSVQEIEIIPEEIRRKYKEAFEISPLTSLDLTALRGKWIDQSQSHNVFMAGTSGKLLSDIYMHAWEIGLKTTYYLRTMGASGIEKSTLDSSKFGLTQKRGGSLNGNGKPHTNGHSTNGQPKLCRLEDPTCEACQ